ncbi:MAG: hypothetical protein GY929_26475 [Actinomycetia bacterium]|nr:hypothetical protein [Actinomycetes bacterium]
MRLVMLEGVGLSVVGVRIGWVVLLGVVALLSGCGQVLRDDIIVFVCNHDVLVPVIDVDGTPTGEFGTAPRARLCQINSDGTGFVELHPQVAVASGPLISPDRAHVSILVPEDGSDGRGRGLLVLDWQGEERAFVASDAGVWSTGAWSPDGEELMFRAGGELVIAPIGEGVRETLVVGDQEAIWFVAPSPDGVHVAVSLWPDTENVPSGERRLVLVNRDSGVVEDLEVVADPNDLAWSPDGQVLAVTSGLDQLSLVDPYRRELVEVIATDDEEPVFSVSWSPDGQLLAYVLGATVMVHDLDRAESVAVTQPQVQVASGPPSWSPDGQRLVVAARIEGDDSPHELMTVRADGTDPKFITRGVNGAGPNGNAWPMWT